MSGKGSLEFEFILQGIGRIEKPEVTDTQKLARFRNRNRLRNQHGWGRVDLTNSPEDLQAPYDAEE